MSVLGLLAVFIVTTLLTGCDVIDDIRTLKADIAALRTFVIALPISNPCGDPGTASSRLCTYQLEITDDTERAKHLYTGRIAPEVYTKDPDSCKKASHKGKRRKHYENLPWDCDYDGTQMPYPDQEALYALDVEDDAGMKNGGSYEFQNVPFKTKLKKLRDCPCIVKAASP